MQLGYSNTIKRTPRKFPKLSWKMHCWLSEKLPLSYDQRKGKLVKTILWDRIRFLSFPSIIQELFLLQNEIRKSFVVDASSVADHSIASPISDHHCNYVQGKRPTRPWRKILYASRDIKRLICFVKSFKLVVGSFYLLDQLSIWRLVVAAPTLTAACSPPSSSSTNCKYRDKTWDYQNVWGVFVQWNLYKIEFRGPVIDFLLHAVYSSPGYD